MDNYNIAPNKKASIKLETTSAKQSRSDLNVAFSTADRETAILEFTVTQGNKPLLLGDSNIETGITYIHSNGLSVKEKLDITDGLNGKISTLVPESISTIPGKVTIQVYVARKQKDHETHQAVVAERITTFTIEKSLAWSFSAETKLNYIIEFDELKASLMQRVIAIEKAMANLEDYVVKVEQARDKGLADIEIARTNSLEDLNTLANTKLKEIDNKGDDYVDELTNIRNSVDDKVNQFNEDVIAADYVKSEQTNNWQKYKMTKENGDVVDLPTGLDLSDLSVLNSLKPGNFYLPAPKNGPGGSASAFLNVQSRNNGTIKKLTYAPYNSDKVFVKRFYQNWSEWMDITHDMETQSGAQRKVDKALEDAKSYTDEKVYDTGWQDLTIMSNVSKHDDAGVSVYRVMNDICEIRFNIGIDKWTNELPIIQPPSNAKPASFFSFLARTNSSPGKNPVVISYDSAKGYFKVWTNGDNSINTGDYVYGHVVYMVGGRFNV